MKILTRFVRPILVNLKAKRIMAVAEEKVAASSNVYVLTPGKGKPLKVTSAVVL